MEEFIVNEQTLYDVWWQHPGGFLRLLYELRPFREGIGTDLARKSIEIADQRKGGLPLQFYATGEPVKPGGVYYATFADYTNNPSLPAIRERINGNAVIPMQNHTLDTVSQAFFQAGFQVSIRRMLPQGFVDLSHGNNWYNQVADQLQFAYEQSYLFRFVAPHA
jgi:hypothetical protein